MLLKKVKQRVLMAYDAMIVSMIILIASFTLILECSDIVIVVQNLLIYCFQFIIIFIVISIIFHVTKSLINYIQLRSVTSNDRGTDSERRLVMKLLKSGVPSELIYHDLYINKSKGDFSQIDLVLITKVGLIVFEVKEYSGWIYGSGKENKWTQVLAGGKVHHSFYNPFMQNATHIVELKNALKSCGKFPVFSVVVFYGNCEFKDIELISEGSYLVKEKRVWEVVKLIHKKNRVVPLDNAKIAAILKKASQNGKSKSVQIKHIKDVQSKMGRDRIFD